MSFRKLLSRFKIFKQLNPSKLPDSIEQILFEFKSSCIKLVRNRNKSGWMFSIKLKLISNILNLTDGILGDCLNIQIIATFNMARERIDSALLRKGRLVAEHKFDKLSIEESNLLLLHLGKNIVVNEPMSLADIYNIDSDYIRTSSINRRIGFLN